MKKLISTKISDFKLRFAREEDLPVILQFIKELAEYEKLSDQVRADEKLLKKHLFGENPQAEVILAEYQQKAGGFALFFHNFSTFLGKPGLYLEDLYIKPDYRNRGFGTEMLKYLAKLAVERECSRFEWSVLTWNQPAIGFYESIGARPLDEWKTYRLTGEALNQLANQNDEP
jgi:ribosomal protein S18 acetylase RimI-like enzyme